MMLTLNNIAVSYGTIEAVHNVSLELNKGELVSLIGANGSGKTTTLKAIAGLLPLTRGDIFFNGIPLATIPAHERIKHGLALVPEGRGIFPHMSVEENLLMGAYHRNDSAQIKQDLAHQYELFPRLKERQYQLSGTLSGGEQQMVAVARALMSRPQLLLLDEPSMGLAPIMVEKIFSVIKKVASEGMTILLVEQNAKVALSLSGRAYVMEHGEIILSGDASQLLNNSAVQAAYLGG
jgi:branched-chain amino acid transport system ATP-binding protein